MIKFILALLAVAACGCAGNAVVVPPMGSGSLELISLEPMPGSRVGRSDVVNARLSYSLPPGFAGEYFLVAQFATTQAGRTSDGSFPATDRPMLSARSGLVDFAFPLHHVLGHLEIATPLEMWFYMNIRTGPEKSNVVARAGPYRFDVH